MNRTMSMSLSNALLLISWVPLLQLHGFDRIQDSRVLMNWNWFFLIAMVVTFIGVWWLVKCIPKKTGFPHNAIKCISIVFFSIFLLGIPVFSCFGNIFEIKMLSDSETSPFPLIVSIISAGLLCVVLFLSWKEAQEEDKPYIPVLKFILASLFLLWQLNLGLHLYLHLPLNFFYVGTTTTIREILIHMEPYFTSYFSLKALAVFGYVILNLLFFGRIFFKGKFKERQDLFFSSTGLLMVIGLFALLFGLINGARVLSSYPLLSFTIFPLTFTTIIGPVLMIALVLVFLGGILSFFKKGLRQSRFPGVVRKKAMVISLAAVILYVLLFKSLWPIQDPAPDILFRSSKNILNYAGDPKNIYIINIASYLEFLVYGKRVVRDLVNKLDDYDASVRQLSAEFLGYLGDEREVEPLIKALEDRDKGVQRKAAGALASIKDPRALKPLVEFLENDDLQYDADEMLRELGKWGDPRFIEPLLKKLVDEDEVFRESIVRALEYFKDTRVIEIWVVDKFVEQLSREKSCEVIIYINDSLEKITGQEYPGKLGKAAEWWQQWWKQHREEFIKKWSTY